MKKAIQLFPTVTGICILLCSCAARRAQETGFLSDYSKLKAQSNVSARYLAPGNIAARYSKFIIDPVEIYLHAGSKAKGKLKDEDIADLKNYMHEALVKAIEDRYEIVYRPGPGVARVRVAITDLKRSRIVQNIWPVSKAIGTGLGGASLEAEIIDSVTGEQIGAVVESQLGNRLSLDGLSTWGDVKAIMDGWAKRFRTRLDEAHGR